MSRLHRFLFIFILFIVWQLRGEAVVVLPFFNLSDSQNLDWIGESIAEAIRESLASEGVLVLDRDSRQEAYRRLAVRQYTRITRASIIKLGEELDAGQVVYGSFELPPSPGDSASSQGSLAVTAHILDLRKMRLGPAIPVSSALADLASLQDHLAWKTLLHFLEPRAAPSEKQFRSRRRSVRLDAMENYIRGLMAPDTDQQHRYFTQAARLDPDFSQPCFQLGRLRLARRDYRVAAGWLERVSPAAPHYHEATFLLGLCRYNLADYETAQAAFSLVLQHVPLNEVWNNLGAAQSRLNLPEALESFEKAFEGDPNDPVYNFNLGYSLWRMGQFDEAADSFRAVLDRAPEDSIAMTMLGRCLKKHGPRKAETRVEALERLKYNYDEVAYRQLQALLEEGR